MNPLSASSARDQSAGGSRSALDSIRPEVREAFRVRRLMTEEEFHKVHAILEARIRLCTSEKLSIVDRDKASASVPESTIPANDLPQPLARDSGQKPDLFS